MVGSKLFGRYKVITDLHEGSHGSTVYKVHDLIDGNRKLAMKVTKHQTLLAHEIDVITKVH